MSKKYLVFWLCSIIFVSACSKMKTVTPVANQTKIVRQSPIQNPIANTSQVEDIDVEPADKLLITSPDGVYITNLTGEKRQRVFSENIPASLSNDGKSVVYYLDGFLHILDIDNGQTQLINHVKVTSFGVGIAWSPDQKKVGFDCVPPGRHTSEICVIVVDNPQLEVLTDSSQYGASGPYDGAEFGAWSSDGSKILFAMRATPLTGGHASGWLQIIDLANGEIQTLLNEKDSAEISRISHPTFSPDGQSILFQGKKVENYAIFQLDINGHSLRRVTDYKFDISNPIFGPDGQTFFAITQDQIIGSLSGVPTLFSLDGNILSQLNFEGGLVRSWVKGSKTK